NNTDKPNPTPIFPPEDDGRQLPTTTINTLTTTINQPTTTINTSTTTINTLTTTINLMTTITTINTLLIITTPLPLRPTNFPKILTTETSTTSKPILSLTIKPSNVITTRFINFISCPICKNEFKESEIEQHLKEHIKNLLSKDTVNNKLEIKKQSIAFDKIKELVSKLTDIQ
ncbi:20856_t:CDS:1, partial [Racocetra persica]